MTWFRGSSYWGTWSRILADRFDGFHTVELNLTPVNGMAGDWDKEVAPIVIRRHCTAPDKGDLIANRLPRGWWDEIGNKVGKDLRHRLVTEDFMSQIDWSLYCAVSSRMGGGGVPLSNCLLLPKANQGRAA